jgi:hypothetical protein
MGQSLKIPEKLLNDLFTLYSKMTATASILRILMASPPFFALALSHCNMGRIIAN